MKYKIGMCVKMNRSTATVTWYTEGIHDIIGFTKNSMGSTILVLNNGNKNSIHPDYILRDEECIKRERKLKLDKLNEINSRR